MTKTHQSNLARTAIYLLENKPPPKFQMLSYFSGDNKYVPHPEEMNECGTSACFAGHGPLALPERWRREEEWESYTRRIFGCDLNSDREGAFLFGATWPNSRRQAAARALVVLEDGVPPPYYTTSSSRYGNRIPTAKLIERLRAFVIPSRRVGSGK